MSQETYEYYEFIRDVLKAAMKEIDRIEIMESSPIEDHLSAAYAELENADEEAKKLQKSAPYEPED